MAEGNSLKFPRPWLKNYDPHVPLEIQYPQTNLSSLFEPLADKYPDKPFISINESDSHNRIASSLVLSG